MVNRRIIVNQFIKQQRMVLGLVVAFFGAVYCSMAVEIVRGPYIQSVTPNSAVIRWSTDTFINSVLYYGADPTTLVSCGENLANLIIQGEALANPVTFDSTNAGDISSRSRTQNAVSWSPPIWDVEDASTVAQQTPNLASIVQEIINLPDWSIDNSMVFIIHGSGERVADALDGNPDGAAVLHVEYEVDGVVSIADFSLGLTMDHKGDFSDDAEERVIDQVVDVKSSDLELTFDSKLNALETEDQIVGLRFTDLDIPSTAIITLAYIQFTVDEVGNTTSEHVMNITGLNPGTKYYYGIGASGCSEPTPPTLLVGGDNNHYFTTAPVPGSSDLTTIWILGDSGEGGREENGVVGEGDDARNVRDSFLEWNGGISPDLWVMLGDNAYRNGTESQYQYGLFDIYPSVLRNAPLWLTLGNHEFDELIVNSTLQSGAYYDLFTMPRFGESGGVASGTEAYYSFDYGNIHFVSLESFSGISQAPESFVADMIAWLEADILSSLQNPDHQWRIAFFHHPPYTRGTHDSDGIRNPNNQEEESLNMRENIVPLLEDAGFDLVLTGHSHSYERSCLINNHYGLSSTFVPEHCLDDGDGKELGDGAYEKLSSDTGTVYPVVGSSSKLGTYFDWTFITTDTTTYHPAHVKALRELGSLVLQVEGGCLNGYFIDDKSPPNILDEFSVKKSGCGEDLIAPTPNPSMWERVPRISDAVAIVMEASEASDPSGVEYFFENILGNGHSSGWQDSPVYTDTLLSPATIYSYRTRTRDKSPNENMTMWSEEEMVQTPILPFRDGFESRRFETGGWTISHGRFVRIQRKAAFAGFWGVTIKNTGYLRNAVSTVGYSNIIVEFMARTQNYDNGERLLVEWRDETDWHHLLDITDTDWKKFSLNLPPEAGNIPGFRLRFSTIANKNNERAFIDNVLIKGNND